MKKILEEIEVLAKSLTDPTTVTSEEMNRLHPVLGSEQAIKNYKMNENERIQADIKRLQDLLSK